MPFVRNYLARSSSSDNIGAGKSWIYNGTSSGSNESLSTIASSGYFNAAQTTLLNVFGASSSSTTGPLSVNDVIQINGNNDTGVYVVTSVTTNVTVVEQTSGGSGTITGGTSLGGDFDIYAGVSGADLTFNGVTLSANFTGSVTGGALDIELSDTAVTAGDYTSANISVD